jgi:hypothetical protein
LSPNDCGTSFSDTVPIKANETSCESERIPRKDSYLVNRTNIVLVDTVWSVEISWLSRS